MSDIDVKAGLQQILKRIDAAYEQRPKVMHIYLINSGTKSNFIYFKGFGGR